MRTNATISLKTGILLHLLYSEVFDHPLTREELIRFASTSEEMQPDDFERLLTELEADKLICRDNEFISVSDEKSKIQKRIDASQRAESLFSKAVKVASFIQKFPFVEGVGISGSLSKGILHSDGDFDFFIITKSNRVWIARTLLILYKKVFLLNSSKYFCVNYFIDSDHLEIEEKNRFTAVEIATLIPVSGEVFDSFYNRNTWVESYFPQGSRTSFDTRIVRKPVFSRMIQGVFSGKIGEKADSRAMKMTLKRWKRKFGDFDSEKFNLTMKTRRYVSKHHPNDFQSKVLQRYETLKNAYREQNFETLKKHQIEL